MIKCRGFTLVELLVFIAVTGFLAATIFYTMNSALMRSGRLHDQLVAKYVASRCMEWFVGQKIINGFSSLTCGNTTKPTFCTNPSGYTVATNIVCTTINSDTQYKTITVTVSGLGNASLTLLVAS